MDCSFDSENTYSEFQINIFSNNRDITKCQSFCTTMTIKTQGYSNTSGFFSENYYPLFRKLVQDPLLNCDQIRQTHKILSNALHPPTANLKLIAFSKQLVGNRLTD